MKNGLDEVVYYDSTRIEVESFIDEFCEFAGLEYEILIGNENLVYAIIDNGTRYYMQIELDGVTLYDNEMNKLKHYDYMDECLEDIPE